MTVGADLLKSVFDKWDKDGDGVISMDEYAQAVRPKDYQGKQWVEQVGRQRQ